jgi:excisionase family DNA binding protein
MEKICIVKLRKKMENTVPAADGFGQLCPATKDDTPCAPRGGEDAAGAADDQQGASPRTLCLTLTPEQTRTLRSEPRLISSLGDGPAERFQAARSADEKLIIQLTFESVAPLRLLKIDEVMGMLRIGRGYVHKLIREGQLKCYRFGRLRRVLLDDVLAYLEGSREEREAPPQDPSPQIAAQAAGRHDLFGRR